MALALRWRVEFHLAPKSTSPKLLWREEGKAGMKINNCYSVQSDGEKSDRFPITKNLCISRTGFIYKV